MERNVPQSEHSHRKKRRFKKCYYRTKLCTYANGPVECPLGRRCSYAHGISQLRPLPPKSPNERSMQPRTTSFHRMRIGENHGYIPPRGRFTGNMMHPIRYPPRQPVPAIPELPMMQMMLPPWFPFYQPYASYGTVVQPPTAPIHMETTYQFHETIRATAGYGSPNESFHPNTVYLNYGTYKTIICRDWERDLYCPRGPNCAYAHGQAELCYPYTPQYNLIQPSGIFP